MASEELQHALQRVSGTTLDSAGAANAWAGSVSTTLVSQRTNLVTNPSFEVDMTSWNPLSGTAVRDTTTASVGIASAKISTPTAVFGGLYMDTGFGSAAPGDVLTLSTAIKTGATNGAAWNLAIQAYDASSVYLGAVYSSAAFPATVAAWTRYSVTTSPLPTGTSFIRVLISNSGSGVAGDIIFADAVLLEKSATADPYFDGSTPSALLVTYAWTAAANASTSTQSTWTPGGLELVGALNVKAGTVGLDIDGVCNVLAGTPGAGVGINACAGLFV